MDSDDDRYSFLQHNKNRYSLNSKIMVTAIISLVVVIILVVILHIYARFVLRRSVRRRAAFRGLSIGVLSTQAQSREPPKTGLDETVIASLPLFAFKDMDNPNGSTTIECAVCLSNIEDEEMARLLPNCKHTFHVDCIDMWLSSHSTCPICRTPAEPRPQKDSAEPVGGAPPTAPQMETMNSTSSTSLEDTSSSGGVAAPQSAKVGGGSGSRLSSFRRMLSLDRSSRRTQSCGQGDGVEDIERQ